VQAKQKARLPAPLVDIFFEEENYALTGLLFAFAAGGWFGAAFGLALRFGFFHHLLGFFGALGANFGTLLALLVDDGFAAEQLDEGVVGAIALAPSGTDNAQVSALPVAKAGTDGVKQLGHGLAIHQVSGGLAASREIATLAERDHLLDLGAHGLCLGDRGLDALFDEERRDQVPQQGTAMARVTT
jgi:hypothetical protein